MPKPTVKSEQATHTTAKRRSLYGLSRPQLEASLVAWDEKPFRAPQIFDWLHKRMVGDPMAMSNLPLALRERLAKEFTPSTLTLLETKEGADGAVKFLLELLDAERIESALIPSRERRTLCMSTQVGCPIGCRFCASGASGFKRNLAPEEMIEQFVFAARRLGGMPDNVVVMGIGEPLTNFDNLVAALETICSPEGFDYAARRVTISTSGIPSGIERLAAHGRQWNLAVSLHAPDDETRGTLIPDASRHPIDKILKACAAYFEKTGRIVTLEYVLLKGINDNPAQARKLAELAKALRAKVNLIPYNETDRPGFARPAERVCRTFAETLEKCHAHVTLRVEKGGGVAAACGQLRASAAKRKDS